MIDDTIQDGDKEDTVRDRNKAVWCLWDILPIYNMFSALNQRLRVQSWGAMAVLNG